ncbi:hypothetical protein D3C76_1569340 [compost metagenome]
MNYFAQILVNSARLMVYIVTFCFTFRQRFVIYHLSGGAWEDGCYTKLKHVFMQSGCYPKNRPDKLIGLDLGCIPADGSRRNGACGAAGPNSNGRRGQCCGHRLHTGCHAEAVSD